MTDVSELHERITVKPWNANLQPHSRITVKDNGGRWREAACFTTTGSRGAMQRLMRVPF